MGASKFQRWTMALAPAAAAHCFPARDRRVCLRRDFVARPMETIGDRYIPRFHAASNGVLRALSRRNTVLAADRMGAAGGNRPTGMYGGRVRAFRPRVGPGGVDV